MKKILILAFAFALASFSAAARADGYDFAYKSITEMPVTTSQPVSGDYTFRFVAADNKVEKMGASTSINNTVSTAVSATSGTTGTTLTNIPGLSIPVVAGTYRFEAYLTGTSTTNSGVKFAIANSGTTTSAVYTGIQYNNATVNAHATTTTAGNAVGAATTVFTDATIEGSIVVSAAGNLTVQFAQNASHADTTTVNAGATFIVSRIN